MKGIICYSTVYTVQEKIFNGNTFDDIYKQITHELFNAKELMSNESKFWLNAIYDKLINKKYKFKDKNVNTRKLINDVNNMLINVCDDLVVDISNICNNLNNEQNQHIHDLHDDFIIVAKEGFKNCDNKLQKDIHELIVSYVNENNFLNLLKEHSMFDKITVDINDKNIADTKTNNINSSKHNKKNFIHINIID
jgi:hypothetical protein